jgi:formate dehydrogenase major subunit
MLKQSVCNYCGVGCDIEAVVQHNEIKEIRANKDGIVSEGKLCVKGKYGYDFATSSKRLPPVKVKKSFLNSHELFLPKELKQKLLAYSTDENGYIYPTLELGYEVVAWKLKQVFKTYNRDSFCAIGGARTSCENSYIFQKFTRKVIKSPHIDNCARVCHAPSLKGMRGVIGEGASTNPFWDIKNSEFLLIFGSNTTEAHPIVANKIISHLKNSDAKLALFDVRDINLSKKADFNCIIPYESNLLVANMIAYEIVKNELYDKDFIEKRTKDFEIYKKEILSDPYANPEFFQKIKGYEYLTDMIKKVAKEYATKKSMILWGLGVTEHIDGSYAVASFCNLAILTGNIGKNGAGLMPLRGQNNVQGTCDMGCLPYYAPDYEHPLVEGKKTPDLINAMLDGEIKVLFNMGEDISHIHPNQNKIQKALKNLEFTVVLELFDNDITTYADVVFGVKSGYEKTGVYINAERRLHLSQPLVENDLPDDWEVLQGIENAFSGKFNYKDTKDIWEEVRVEAPKRFSGASYELLEKNRLNGLQWPIDENGATDILHKEQFRTKDGLGHFKYKKWFLRGMVKELLKKKSFDDFYLTTGRVLAHYNNASQTKKSPKLQNRAKDDIVLISFEDENIVKSKQYITLVSKYGRTAPLKFKLSKNIKKGTLFVSFHHAKSRINFLFGDEADELTKTARFKSIKVKIE